MASPATDSAATVSTSIPRSLATFDPFGDHPFTSGRSHAPSLLGVDVHPSSSSNPLDTTHLTNNNTNNNKARSSHTPTSYNVLYARAAKAATSPPEEQGGGGGGGDVRQRQRSSYVSLDTAPGTLPLSSAVLEARQNSTMTTLHAALTTTNTTTTTTAPGYHRMSNGCVTYTNNGADPETRRRAQELILRAGSGSSKHDDELPVLKRKKAYVLDGF